MTSAQLSALNLYGGCSGKLVCALPDRRSLFQGHEIKYFVHPQFVPGLLQELRPTRGLEAGVEFRERLFDSSARCKPLLQAL